jgi:hypothetical protein
MNFDLECQVVDTATELFALAMTETNKATEVQFNEALCRALDEVMARHPGYPIEMVCFAMGRALGRMEGVKRRRPPRDLVS